ncbi:aminopeptidase P family N-terminal domain-containing protein, partial [Chloroflexota bacterium]
MLTPQARLSQLELERRHESVKHKMKEHGLEVLLISGVRFVASAGYLRYLSNWAEPFAGESLVFPLEGEPIFCARTGERAYLVENLLGLKTVTGSTASTVAQLLRETGLKRIGICGLSSMFASFFVQLTQQLPDVKLEDASELLDEVRMVKSEEELGWIKKSARLVDLAYEMFSNLAEEGESESNVFVEIEHMVKRLGAENTYFMMSADPRPVPKFIDLAFDRYERGDLVLFNAEIAGRAGYY